MSGSLYLSTRSGDENLKLTGLFCTHRFDYHCVVYRSGCLKQVINWLSLADTRAFHRYCTNQNSHRCLPSDHIHVPLHHAPIDTTRWYTQVTHDASLSFRSPVVSVRRRSWIRRTEQRLGPECSLPVQVVSIWMRCFPKRTHRTMRNRAPLCIFKNLPHPCASWGDRLCKMYT